MGRIPEVWSLVWGDASPSERARTLRVAFRALILFHIAWACGWLPGWQGFARAEEVDGKIQTAIEPIQKQLTEINQKLAISEAVQRRILQGQIAAQLRDLHRFKCTTLDETTRARMERDIEDAQQEYRALSAERYPLPPCREL